MIINRLKIAQLRAFAEAEFEFRPGMNLLVGVNGVGKSTALDALRYLLSHLLKRLSFPRYQAMMFEEGDIKAGRDFLDAEVSCEADGTAFTFLVHTPQAGYVVDKNRAGQVREQTIATPNLTQWIFHAATPTNEKKLAKHLQQEKLQPLAVYFSPHRSLINLNAYKTKGEGIASAVAEALAPRELRVPEFADWWLTREALAQEGLATALPQLEAVQHAISRFLDGCSNLRAVKEPKTTLLIDKDRVTLDVRQLSDGERGILALVLDLTRRLAQANPHLQNPAQEASAIVLIDELDLHLHPRWQRTIVEKLTTTFPLCQFIATTHSPQIVGEVSPEQIYILSAHGAKPFKPDQSLGMDTNWILERLMETDSRDTETGDKLDAIADLIEQEEYEQAQERIDSLRSELGDFPELIRLQTRVDKFSILNEL